MLKDGLKNSNASTDEEKGEGGVVDVVKPVEEAPASTQAFWLLIWMFK